MVLGSILSVFSKKDLSAYDALKNKPLISFKKNVGIRL